MNYFESNGEWICKECERKFTSKQATTSHIYRAHVIPGKSTGGGHVIGVPAWNKGLSKETDDRVKKYGETQQGKPGTFTGKKHSLETKSILSRKASINNKGGRSKWYEVSGQKVQGTWERNVANKLTELHVEWEKLKTNRHTFDYEMSGKVRCYTPDFYLPKYDCYLEIKGRWWGNDKEKMDIVLKTYPDKKILIIEKEQYEKILQGELVWSFQRLPEEQ